MRRRPVIAATALVAVLGLSACSVAAPGIQTGTDTSAAASAAAAAVWDSSVVHDIQLTVDQDALDELVDTYVSTGEKEWVSATVTIDGVVLENVGLKLKGNSSLRGITDDTAPQEMPWIIRLDKFVDGQSLDGETEFVVRANSSETALNEAVALDLLSLAGLASEEAISSTFSVNGGDTALRLVIQNPNDGWMAQEFTAGDLLYKAESTGDYSYRGDDPESYTDVFDQEAGDDDLAPLIDFLQFINESDDATFTAELGDHLDVEAFAKYLAFQDLVDNFDDIDGPGNNSYLAFDQTTGLMTVVNWDLNLAFGVQNVTGGGAPGQNGGGGPGGGARPGQDAARDAAGDDAAGGGGAGGAGGPSSGNVLAERFLALFPDLYDTAVAELTETLYSSGSAQTVLDDWVTTLSTQDIVPSSTITEEASAISEQFTR